MYSCASRLPYCGIRVIVFGMHRIASTRKSPDSDDSERYVCPIVRTKHPAEAFMAASCSFSHSLAVLRRFPDLHWQNHWERWPQSVSCIEAGKRVYSHAQYDRLRGLVEENMDFDLRVNEPAYTCFDPAWRCSHGPSVASIHPGTSSLRLPATW